MKVGFDWTRARGANHANPLPSKAPQAASTLSVSICLTRRERDAPEGAQPVRPKLHVQSAQPFAKIVIFNDRIQPTRCWQPCKSWQDLE
jgi:hypothetical protein